MCFFSVERNSSSLLCRFAVFCGGVLCKFCFLFFICSSIVPGSMGARALLLSSVLQEATLLVAQQQQRPTHFSSSASLQLVVHPDRCSGPPASRPPPVSLHDEQIRTNDFHSAACIDSRSGLHGVQDGRLWLHVVRQFSFRGSAGRGRRSGTIRDMAQCWVRLHIGLIRFLCWCNGRSRIDLACSASSEQSRPRRTCHWRHHTVSQLA